MGGSNVAVSDTLRRSGTLDECEAILCTVESATSIEEACWDLRTVIELPGVLRDVARLVRRYLPGIQRHQGAM